MVDKKISRYAWSTLEGWLNIILTLSAVLLVIAFANGVSTSINNQQNEYIMRRLDLIVLTAPALLIALVTLLDAVIKTNQWQLIRLIVLIVSILFLSLGTHSLYQQIIVGVIQ